MIREYFQGKTAAFDRKRRNAKYEFGMKSTRGGKRTEAEAWRRNAHTQKFCGSQGKLLPGHQTPGGIAVRYEEGGSRNATFLSRKNHYISRAIGVEG